MEKMATWGYKKNGVARIFDGNIPRGWSLTPIGEITAEQASLSDMQLRAEVIMDDADASAPVDAPASEPNPA